MSPATVPEANPPIPFVTSHSRVSAACRSLQMSRPKVTVIELAGAAIVLSVASFALWAVAGIDTLQSGRRLCAPPGDSLLAALLNQLGCQSRPAGLMAGADSGPVIAVEVLVEQDEIFPVRIVLKFLHAAEHRPAAVGSA